MTVHEYLLKTARMKLFDVQALRPHIICNDGSRYSIQASSDHYCTPCKNMSDHYDSVEIMVFNTEDEELLPFSETSNLYDLGVCAFVPIQIIEKVVKKHGGIDIEKTFRGDKK